MLLQCCVTKAPQIQVVVCVVHGIPDSDILEQMVIYPKDVIYTGYHFLDVMEHDSRPAIPCPEAVKREEILCHVFQGPYFHFCGSGHVSIVVLRSCYVCVEVSCNQELLTPEALYNDHHDVLQGVCIMWHKIAYNSLPEDPSHFQIEAEVIWAVCLQGLHLKVPIFF